MKATAHSVWFALSLALAALIPAQAKDELRVSYPSKVESSKGKEREKLFSKWMSGQAAVAYNEEMWKKGQQLFTLSMTAHRTSGAPSIPAR
jgi:hypothetical protein